MASMTALMDRLILALNMAGENVTLSKKTFFSRNYGHMITKYKIKHERELMCSTYSAAEAVKCLAGMWEEVAKRGKGQS